jgi:hypothetical protein
VAVSQDDPHGYSTPGDTALPAGSAAAMRQTSHHAGQLKFVERVRHCAHIKPTQPLYKWITHIGTFKKD